VTRQAQITKLLLVERERDDLRVVNVKLRNKLLEICAACESCGGSGCVEDIVQHARFGPQVQVIPCEACLDIREVLDP
jgi:hypothetical protein